MDLDGNVLNAGQVILFNCNDSVVSNFQLSDCSVGISGGYLINNTYSNNSVENCITGISLVDSDSCILSKNNASQNKFYGILLDIGCNKTTVSENIAKWGTDKDLTNYKRKFVEKKTGASFSINPKRLFSISTWSR